MSPPRGGRRSFPGEPGRWWGGPRPRRPPGPEDAWGEPPWEPRRRRSRRRWCPRHARAPRAFPWNEEEEDGRWAPPWDDREAIVGPEEDFTRDDFTDWLPPGRRAPGPCPGDGPWKEEEEGDRRWAPHGCPPWPPWGDGDFQGPEDGFGEGWHPEPPPEPWPEFPEEEQPPPWPPAGPAGTPRGFRGCRPPWGHHWPRGRRGRHPRGSHHRQLTPVPPEWCPRPRRGPKPRSKPSPVGSKRSQRTARKEPQPPEPPEPPAPVPGAAKGPEQSQDLPEGSGRVLEPPGPAGTPPAAGPSATESEQVAAVTLVELEAGQGSVSSRDRDCCASGTEESSAGIQGRLEVEPLSPAVPKAGPEDGALPPSPAAPPDPAGREFLRSSPSGEVRAELSPRSQEQQPRGAGEAEAEAVWNGPLQSLQPPQNSQEFCPPGAAADPEAQPGLAPDACAPPEPPPGPPQPPGPRETEPAVSGQHQLCSTLPTPFPAGIDFRSAAVLARKAQIELSYQQFSLTVAVVATMLLQKEPSMEAALGLALRANLRQCRIHHLQELEDFIDSYDSAGAGL